MTWYTPKTWVTGEAVSAADLNTQIRENLLHLFNSNITYLGSPSAPYNIPGNWKALEVAVFMSTTLNYFNRFATYPVGTSFVVLAADNDYVREWRFTLVPTINQFYTVPPAIHAGTVHTSFVSLEVNGSTGELRLKNFINNYGYPNRSIRVLVFSSAPPSSVTSSTGTAATAPVFPGVPAGIHISTLTLTSSLSTVTVVTNIERGETFEVYAATAHNAAISVRLGWNGDNGTTGWYTQLLAANGTSVTATRYSNFAYLYDATSSADRMAVQAVGALSGDGYVSVTAMHPYGAPTGVSLGVRSLAKNTTFTRLTNADFIAAAGAEFIPGSSFTIVRRPLY